MQNLTQDVVPGQQNFSPEEIKKQKLLVNLAKAQAAKKRKAAEKKNEIQIVPLVQQNLRTPSFAEVSEPQQGYGPRDPRLYSADWEIPTQYERSPKPKRKVKKPRREREPEILPESTFGTKILSGFGTVVTTVVSLLAVSLIPIVVSGIQSDLKKQSSLSPSSFLSHGASESDPNLFAGQSIFR